jgi:hypothetical protein
LKGVTDDGSRVHGSPFELDLDTYGVKAKVVNPTRAGERVE